MYHLLCDCVLLLTVTIVKITCQPEEAIRYRVQEGVPVGTRIGNVLFDSGIRRRYTKDVLHKLDFRFLSPPQIPLSIGVSDAVLRTVGPIDRESMTTCRQKVTCDVSVDVAVHPLSYFRIVKVVLEVIDVNDNPPWFAPSQHSTLMISESASVGATFLLPSATDPDSPQYGVRRYALYPVGGGGRHDDSIDSKFILRETPKLDGFLDVRLMLRQKLDREMVEEYHLTLVAFDGGEPALNDSISVTVRVLDSNDNDPVFEKSVYEVHIAENVRPGTRILSVRATDADLDGTAQLVYGLAAQTRSFYGHAFLVDNRTGDVYVTDRLDRETLAEYQLIVTAEDAPVGSPEVHTVDVTVHVTLDDVNDNAPRIVINTLQAADSSFAHVTENSPSGTFVAHVTATDPDTDGNGIINCTLRTGNGGRSDGSGLLRLVPRPLHQSQLRSEVDYQLVTSGITIDRERADDLNISVTCSDNGVPAAQTSVKHLRVFVNDENDNTPTFKSQVIACFSPTLLFAF
jgi:Cadherin domain